MAILNHFTTACWKNLQCNRLNKQLFYILRNLHKSAGSEGFGIPTAREGAMPERLITPTNVGKKTRIKTLKEMPGPSALSNFIEFFWRDGFSRVHEIQMEHRKKYGKIFKSRFGPQLVVSVADRDLVAEVLRAEGVAPQRGNMDYWKEYRDMRGRSTGLISAEGEDWLKMRSVLRQLVMRPRDVAVFSDDVNQVVDDLIKRVAILRTQESDGATVLNVNDLFFKYAMEGVAFILYESRLGCLENEIPQETQDYIGALHLMFSSFKTTMYAGAIPKWLRPVIPKPWEEFCLSWDGLFKFSSIHVDKRLAEIKAQLEVSVADRDLVAEVLRAEGVAPQRGNMDYWKEYRDMRGRSTGLISAEGEDWLKMRSVLRQLVMRPRDVAVFSDDVNQVVDDLIKRVAILRTQESDGATVLNVNDLFFKYAMEGVAFILYESRLGCLENEIPQETQDYIGALHLMFSSFKTTMYAGAIPKWLRPVIPKPWEEFCLSWDGLFKFSSIHVDKRLAEIKAQLERGEEVKGGLLTHMLITKEMSTEEIYANFTEMLLAGVDTTSFTLSWACYLLARHPQIQQQIFTEVKETLGPGAVATADDVPRLPLIRGLVKETLRFFPVLPGNGRITQDDLVVGGYFIPKGIQLALCHYSTSFDEENFGNASDFRPDRWIRKDSTDRVDNFGSIPFGYGIRSCIGKRIAELELHLALTRLIQKFHIGVSPLTTDVKAKTHGLLCPAAPIHLQFIDREN